MEIFRPMKGRTIPPSALERYRVERLIGSKREKFQRNLKRNEVKAFMCLDVGEMILDKKRILGKKCWLIEIAFEKIKSFGLRR